MLKSEKITVIVDYGKGSEVLRIAKKQGVSGGTIFLGKGTVKDKLLELLSLTEIRKEIVVMIAPSNIVPLVTKKLKDVFQFGKKHHGICFTAEIGPIYGFSEVYNEIEGAMKTMEEDMQEMYDSITVIVDRGKAEEVVDSATAAGARGGTVINARGSGIHERSTVFSMEIEPEKEIVLIVVKQELTESVTTAIRKAVGIDEPGSGILFVQAVKETFGIY